MPDNTMMTNPEQKLNNLFAAYRSACPEVDCSAAFVPGIWQKIEARRRNSILQLWTRNFIAASATLCLLFGLFLISPVPSGSHYAYYLDVLDDDHDSEIRADLHLMKSHPTMETSEQPILVEEE